MSEDSLYFLFLFFGGEAKLRMLRVHSSRTPSFLGMLGLPHSCKITQGNSQGALYVTICCVFSASSGCAKET